MDEMTRPGALLPALEHAQAVDALSKELHALVLEKGFVVHLSTLQKVEQAVARCLALQALAAHAGLERPWGIVLAECQAVYIELENRQREPETLVEGDELVRLIDGMAKAAEAFRTEAYQQADAARA